MTPEQLLGLHMLLADLRLLIARQDAQLLAQAVEIERLTPKRRKTKVSDGDVPTNGS